MISQILTKELQTIIREDCGVDLDINQAEIIGNNLVSYFDLLNKISHKDGFKN